MRQTPYKPSVKDPPSFETHSLNFSQFKSQPTLEVRFLNSYGIRFPKSSNHQPNNPTVDPVLSPQGNDPSLLNQSSKAFYSQTQKKIKENLQKLQTKELNNREFSSIESLESLKKIYRPRKASRERLTEIKNASLRNRILKQFDVPFVTSRDKSDRSLRNETYFRIRNEKSLSGLQVSDESFKKRTENKQEGSLTAKLNKHEGSLTAKLKKIALSNRWNYNPDPPSPIPEPKEFTEIPETDSIKLSTSYKHLSGKTLDRLYSKESKLLQKAPSNESKNPQKTEAKPAENQLNFTNQPNSFNISVNLKPTFHLSLSSAIQNDNFKQILESFQLKSNEFKISHPAVVNVQTNYDPKEQKTGHLTEPQTNTKNSPPLKKFEESSESEIELDILPKEKRPSLKSEITPRLIEGAGKITQKIEEHQETPVLENIHDSKKIEFPQYESLPQKIEISPIAVESAPKNPNHYESQSENKAEKGELGLISRANSLNHIITIHSHSVNAIHHSQSNADVDEREALKALELEDIEALKGISPPKLLGKRLSNGLPTKMIQSTSFELVRSFNKKQSEEEKEALNMKIESKELAEFKSQFYNFSSSLKIPKRTKRQSTLFLLEKKEMIEKTKEILKSAQKPVKSEIYLKKLNFQFSSKNQFYTQKKQKIRSEDRKQSKLLRSRKSLIFTKFEECSMKFVDKLKKFFSHHQNPFFWEVDNRVNMFNGHLLGSRFSLYKEAGPMINLSEILSKDSPSLLLQNTSVISGMDNDSSSSFAEDENILNFTTKKNNERYTIKIKSPEEWPHALETEHENGPSNQGSPTWGNHQMKPSRHEKLQKSTSFKKHLYETEELHKKQLLNKSKLIFEELDRKSTKVFELYNYRKLWKLFKVLFFANMQILLSNNFYEHMCFHSKPVTSAENEVKASILHKKSKSNHDKTSFLILCPFSLFLDEGPFPKYIKSKNVIIFENIIDSNELMTETNKPEENDDYEMKKSIQKSSEEENENDSPLLIWEPISRLSIVLEDEYLKNSNRLNDSEISLEHDEEFYENEKSEIVMKNGEKNEILLIPFKTLEFLIKIMKDVIVCYLTTISPDSQASLQQSFPLIRQLDLHSYFNDAEAESALISWKKEFIRNAVEQSQFMTLVIRHTLLNHPLIKEGGFEDFIAIPPELLNSSVNLKNQGTQDEIINESENYRKSSVNVGSSKTLKTELTEGRRSLKSLPTTSHQNMIDKAFRAEQELSSFPHGKDKRMFVSSEEIDLTAIRSNHPEIKIAKSAGQNQDISHENRFSLGGNHSFLLQKPTENKKPHLRRDRKSFSGLILRTDRNAGLKKMVNKPLNTSQAGLAEEELMLKHNKFLQGIQRIEETEVSCPEEEEKRIGNNLLVSPRKVIHSQASMSEINLTREQIQRVARMNNTSKKNNVSISEKEKLSPQNSPNLRNSLNKLLRNSVKKGEYRSMLERSIASNPEEANKKKNRLAELELSSVFINFIHKKTLFVDDRKKWKEDLFLSKPRSFMKIKGSICPSSKR